MRHFAAVGRTDISGQKLSRPGTHVTPEPITASERNLAERGLSHAGLTC